jgi:hypothetical protein
MGPEIEIYRDIAIRYGYVIRDDVFYAHFDLPEKQPSRSTTQTRVRTYLSPVMSESKRRVQAHNVEEVLRDAKKQVDIYLDE